MGALWRLLFPARNEGVWFLRLEGGVVPPPWRPSLLGAAGGLSSPAGARARPASLFVRLAGRLGEKLR